MMIFALLLAAPLPAQEIFVSANDDNQELVDGQQVVPDHPVPGSVSVIALDRGTARIVANVPAPASVIGPPRSIALTPDARFAIVTASRKVSPQDRRQIVPDDRVTLIDLHGTPHVVQVAHAGAGASGVAIDASGTRVLIANRSAGTVSLFALDHGRLTLRQTIAVGAPDSSPAQPLFYAGGRRALVASDGDSKVAMLAIDGDHMRLLPETLAAGLRPYAIDSAGARRFAVTGNIGGGGKDVDTISLIDLQPERPRVVDTVAVGLTPEGLKMSPDGQFVAVNVNNGSNDAHAAPGYSDHGLLQIWRIADGHLRFVTQAPVGPWGQGVAWSRDGKTLLVQIMVGETIACFTFDGRKLTPGAILKLPAGPAAIASVAP
jgi:DNA-binding beta-propeller fold protein YncE